MSTSSCKACGASILWVRSHAGKAMPLNAKAEKRIVVSDLGGRNEVARVVDTYTSHFVDCPAAHQFRRRKDDP